MAYRVTGPSGEVAPLHQLWARTCRTASVFSGRDGQQLITDFWQKRLSPVEMGCSSSIGFSGGKFCMSLLFNHLGEKPRLGQLVSTQLHLLRIS